jgi:UDP-glucose 4-epimerase
MPDHNPFAGQPILVTGATGFIGSHLCRALSRSGAAVHAVSRTRHDDDGAHWWQADLTDIATVRKLVHAVQPAVIFHLSGHVTAAPHLNLVLSTFESHVISTVYLLTAATELGCRRLVLTGSLTEPSNANSAASSPYAAAKVTSSTYGRMFHALYKTPVTIVRPFMAYGPMQDPQKLVPYVTLSLLRGETPKLASGQWPADWVYIDDVIDGFLAAAQVRGAEGCTIDLGSGVMTPVRTVVNHIVELVGGTIAPSFGALPDRPAEEVKVADLAYAQAKIGWRPATLLEEGLARTVAWYRDRFAPAAYAV